MGGARPWVRPFFVPIVRDGGSGTEKYYNILCCNAFQVFFFTSDTSKEILPVL